MNDPLDWSLLQALSAVARAGSLSAAARATRQSQPTLTRMIARLEDRVGQPLFTRHPTGLTLTAAGAALLEPVEDMRAAAARAELRAGGAPAVFGTVRISASVVFAHHHLPPIVARLRAEAPRVAIELVPSDRTENLLYREADIAVRMVRPDQPDVVARHLGEVTLGIYAHDDYLARIGGPPARLEDVEMVGFDRSDLLLRGMRAMGLPRSRDDFPVRVDDQAVYTALVLAGAGAGMMQDVIAARHPGLQRLFPDLDLPRLPVWLVAARALRGHPRMRLVWDALVRDLAPVCTPPARSAPR